MIPVYAVPVGGGPEVRYFVGTLAGKPRGAKEAELPTFHLCDVPGLLFAETRGENFVVAVTHPEVEELAAFILVTKHEVEPLPGYNGLDLRKPLRYLVRNHDVIYNELLVLKQASPFWSLRKPRSR